ncbi:MAG: nucleotidyltransferase family protein [Candidatus Lindowbacteria bacterium]|nr:nucleotidyltransferase family protein [Candidatus Lindowbacteria bacterium]
MSFDTIILAGGKGLRLKSEIKDLPKPMAPILNRPFLEHQLDHLTKSGVKKVVLAVGYRYQVIQKHFGTTYKGIKIAYSIEKKLLGTGGGIRKALSKTSSRTVLVLNGDTLFPFDLRAFSSCHKATKSDLTIALKLLRNYSRFGTVKLRQGRCVSFEEKKKKRAGLINAGVYLLDRRSMLQAFPKSPVFSFEEFLENSVSSLVISGNRQAVPFLDIGLPEDYRKAERFLLKSARR